MLELSNKVVNLNNKTVFSLEETNNLLSIINKITYKHQSLLNKTLTQLEQEGHLNNKSSLKIDAQKIIDDWNRKIKKLGAKPSGIWNADFDFGQGYFCWKFPETEITHWHKYSEGFSNRRPVNTIN